jgi:hypothetical protein
LLRSRLRPEHRVDAFNLRRSAALFKRHSSGRSRSSHGGLNRWNPHPSLLNGSIAASNINDAWVHYFACPLGDRQRVSTQVILLLGAGTQEEPKYFGNTEVWAAVTTTGSVIAMRKALLTNKYSG